MPQVRADRAHAVSALRAERGYAVPGVLPRDDRQAHAGQLARFQLAMLPVALLFFAFYSEARFEDLDGANSTGAAKVVAGLFLVGVFGYVPALFGWLEGKEKTTTRKATS